MYTILYHVCRLRIANISKILCVCLPIKVLILYPFCDFLRIIKRILNGDIGVFTQSDTDNECEAGEFCLSTYERIIRGRISL